MMLLRFLLLHGGLRFFTSGTKISMFIVILGRAKDLVIDEELVAITNSYDACPTPSFIYAKAIFKGMRHQFSIF